MSDGSNHIDPGDPPRSRYPDDLNCHNPDPINAWRPGSVEEQRRRVHEHITQAEMGPAATKPNPEREGPDYGKGDAADSEALWVKLNMGIDSLPDRTNMILQGVASDALVSFVRHHLQYGDSDAALGYQGQFSELYHIVTKLKRLMWDRNWAGMATNTATGEIKEQLEALIGHSLLALNLLDEGNKDGRG